MSIPCSVIQDLLPSYIDGLCAEETNLLMTEHCAQCEDCGAMLSRMREPIEPPPVLNPFKKVRRYYGRKILAVGLVALFAAVLAVGLGWLGLHEMQGEGVSFRSLALERQMNSLGESLIGGDYAQAAQLLGNNPAETADYLGTLFGEPFTVEAYAVSGCTLKSGVPEGHLRLTVKGKETHVVRLDCTLEQTRVKLYFPLLEDEPVDQEGEFLHQAMIEWANGVNLAPSVGDARERVSAIYERVYGSIPGEDYPRCEVLVQAGDSVTVRVTYLEQIAQTEISPAKSHTFSHEGNTYRGTLELMSTSAIEKTDFVVAIYCGRLFI